MARGYTHIKELLAEIKERLEQGKSHGEIEEEFQLSGERPIHNLLKRERRRERKQEEGVLPKRRGRKAAVALSEYKYENKRLKMENELLRDFLRLTGRR